MNIGLVILLWPKITDTKFGHENPYLVPNYPPKNQGFPKIYQKMSTWKVFLKYINTYHATKHVTQNMNLFANCCVVRQDETISYHAENILSKVHNMDVANNQDCNYHSISIFVLSCHNVTLSIVTENREFRNFRPLAIFILCI